MRSIHEILLIARTRVTSRNAERKHGKLWREAMATSLPFRLHIQNHPRYIGRRPAP